MHAGSGGQCEGATTEAGCNAIPGCLWSTGLDGGAIAGIIIALLVGFCCIGACVFFGMKKPAGKGGAVAVSLCWAVNSGRLPRETHSSSPTFLICDSAFSRPCWIHSRTSASSLGPYSRPSAPMIIY